MTAKKQIISVLDTLDSKYMLKVLDYIMAIHIKTDPVKSVKKNKAHLFVREALKNIKSDLSNEILNERKERL